jgi:hypothetical protein
VIVPVTGMLLVWKALNSTVSVTVGVPWTNMHEADEAAAST